MPPLIWASSLEFLGQPILRKIERSGLVRPTKNL